MTLTSVFLILGMNTPIYGYNTENYIYYLYHEEYGYVDSGECNIEELTCGAYLDLPFDSGDYYLFIINVETGKVKFIFVIPFNYYDQV